MVRYCESWALLLGDSHIWFLLYRYRLARLRHHIGIRLVLSSQDIRPHATGVPACIGLDYAARGTCLLHTVKCKDLVKRQLADVAS